MQIIHGIYTFAVDMQISVPHFENLSEHMRKLAVCVTVIYLAALIVGVSEAAEKSSLRILYVGHPGSEREGDFVEFLREHFVLVETGDLAKFREGQTEGFDVTILDYDGDGFESPKPGLSREYSRSTVTVGVVGAFICDSAQLKTGYL